MTETPAASANTPRQPVFATVALEEPFARGDTMIESITLRKPKAGELRGVVLQDIMRAEIGSVLNLLPRISDPILTVQEANELSSADIAECAGTISGFFMTAAQLEMIKRMTLGT